MKYAILFLMVSAILWFYPVVRGGGWWWLLAWPASSFAILSLGYGFLGVKIFAKKSNGRIGFLSLVILLPYLAYLWLVWYLVRILSSENLYDEVYPDLIIGRKLMGWEIIEGIDHVIDLTCEFNKPKQFNRLDYYAFPILDGAVPKKGQIDRWVDIVMNLPGRKYIHCAEGHGRTGMLTIAYLVKSGRCQSVDEALKTLKIIRPLMRLGSQQLKFLYSWERQIN
ncbi:MAG: dual specificity protein phosphatase family protein [Jaaginema sp. PMC 1079.18]|nr:dual specificity protein phosphatase family protein [Jaaginema sp. PMC 1080.18]MEC4853116.1 dual specificity protein phosphatase family protein [Jaaginema sp. PMC 1079.18]MEC4867950.1 dual specificity protein phosphatase family protein [Jaaginema sp. PMC 1078.18]